MLRQGLVSLLPRCVVAEFPCLLPTTPHAIIEDPESSRKGKLPLMRPVVLLISALLWVSVPCGARAAIVIDFEDIGHDACFYFVSDPISAQGFLLTDPVAGSNLFTCNAASDPRGYATNGTRTLLTRNLVITHGAGAPFDLISFDLGEQSSDEYTPDPHVWVVGTKQSGGTVITDFTADGLFDGPGGIADFETLFPGDEFSDLASVQITDLSSENFFLDNISMVPEPGTAALLMLGLTGLFAARRLRG